MRGKYRRRREKREQARAEQQKLFQAEQEPGAEVLPSVSFIWRYSMEVLALGLLACIVAGFFCAWFFLGALAVAGVMVWIRCCHPEMRRYLDVIESRNPKPGPEEPGVEAWQIMYGLKLRDHYRNVPQHLRRKSWFGKYG